jgi:phosphate:Na+ symporter
LHPADLPVVLAGPGAGWWSGMFGVLALVLVGLVMTALMQSSTAAVAVTLSGYFAGAIGLDQSCALIIGQNIGTATSSALAAIGASTTAKRLAVAPSSRSWCAPERAAQRCCCRLAEHRA